MVVTCRWVAVAVLMSVLGACSSSESGDDDDDNEGTAGNAGDNGGNAGGGSTAVGTELNADMLFSPMYSAFDGEHEFKVPAIVNGYTGVEWSAEDPTMVELVKNGDNGVMITTRKAGTTRIIARAGSLSGSAEIHITEANPADWTLGEQRYNNGVPLPAFDPMAAMGMGFSIPDDLSCKNCHGGGAMALSVEHTPQQTGGYSDDDLDRDLHDGSEAADGRLAQRHPDVHLLDAAHVAGHCRGAEGRDRVPAFARAGEPGRHRLRRLHQPRRGHVTPGRRTRRRCS